MSHEANQPEEQKMDHDKDQKSDIGHLDDLLRTIERGLKDGGPDVDGGLLLGYVEKTLPPAEMEQVKRLTRIWKNWFWAELQLNAMCNDIKSQAETVMNGS